MLDQLRKLNINLVGGFLSYFFIGVDKLNTLIEIKDYLRIDFDDDDDLLNELIEASEVYINKMVGISYKKDEKAIKLAKILQKKLVNEMYRNRNTGALDKVQDKIVTSMLDSLSISGSDESGTM